MPRYANIILLFADQFRGDAINNPEIQTPNLNFMAARGTNFTHAYTPCPSCIPARAMLWTGMSQWHTGILSMNAEQPDLFSDYPHTLAGELTKVGYQTHLSGKGHFTPQDALMGFQSTEVDEAGRVEKGGFKDAYRTWFAKHAPAGVTPDDHGVDFNSWVAREWHLLEYLHPTAWTMTSAIGFLQRRDRERPFFLNISFDRPHSPYVPPRSYWDMYYNRPISVPPPSVGGWAGRSLPSPTVAAQHGLGVDPNALQGKLSEYQVHRARSGYRGEISFVDAQIGRLMTFLRRYQPEARGNTVFLFASDHGDMQGDHHFWRKSQPYEGSVRVPLILLPPEGLKSLRHVADEPVSLMDIMPTLLEYAGVERPPTVEGESLAPLTQCVAGPKAWREYIHGEHGQMHYVTDGRRKYIWFPVESREQFFDLECDPTECQDLIDDPLRENEIVMWRGRLARELEGRDCGWVRGGRLHYPGMPMISPYKYERWRGKNER
ncbi:MAG: sulfatase-like hydrolase/transferase [Phycisphaerales bacterium]|nr:sulfatase-like hydrolase/transferase [Phycisphaerales bacterium]